MANIDWEKTWNSALKNKELFPIKAMNKKTVSIACPTRFSDTGELSIDVTPTFNDESIVLELLVFNDNLSLKDLPKLDDNDKEKASSDKDSFNDMVNQLVEYELSNRIMERFTIKSKGFESEDEAESALVDYINNKATESGRMFDDKLDELNDTVANKDEKYSRTISKIKESRRVIMQKIESILNSHYGWKANKNEAVLDDSVIECYDDNNNLMAVISLVDDCVIVDLAKGISAKVNMMQADEDIEAELVADVDNAQDILADRELDQLKDVVADNAAGKADMEADYMESLARRVTKLESLYIRKRLHKIH